MVEERKNLINVLIEFGSFNTKCGFCGDSYPISIIQTPNSISSILNQKSINVMEIDSIVKKFLKFILLDSLKVNINQLGSVILIENIFSNSRFLRGIVSKLLLNFFLIPKVCFINCEQILVFASSSSSYHINSISKGDNNTYDLDFGTSLIIDIGHSGTRIIPIVCGSPIIFASFSSSEGFNWISKRLQKRLGISSSFKQSFDYSSKYLGYGNKINEISNPKLSLDDRTIPIFQFINGIENENDEEEIEFKGLSNLIIESIFKSPIDLRRVLISKILLIGGGSLIPGIQLCLYESLSKKLPEFLSKSIGFSKIPFISSYSSWSCCSASSISELFSSILTKSSSLESFEFTDLRNFK